MKKNYFITALSIIFILVGCEQNENLSPQYESDSYKELYDKYMQAFVYSENIDDLQGRKAYINEEIGSYSWDCTEQTRSTNDMTIEEQMNWIKNTQPAHIQAWITRLNNSFQLSANDISVEEISSDATLNENEKKMLTAILAGGNYLKRLCISGGLTRATAADCKYQYDKDCKRALAMYAVTGTTGALTGGIVGLGAATVACAMQLTWAKQDYDKCMETVK